MACGRHSPGLDRKYMVYQARHPGQEKHPLLSQMMDCIQIYFLMYTNIELKDTIMLSGFNYGPWLVGTSTCHFTIQDLCPICPLWVWAHH